MAQAKTYARVFMLAPIGSALVNGQNYHMAIIRARFGVKLWTEDPRRLAEQLEGNSGERTSLLEGLGGWTRTGIFRSPGDILTSFGRGRAEQERRERALTQQLGRRPAPPNGIAEQLVEGALEIAVRLDRIVS